MKEEGWKTVAREQPASSDSSATQTNPGSFLNMSFAVPYSEDLLGRQVSQWESAKTWFIYGGGKHALKDH